MNKVLIISGTPIFSGAEYVLKDYLDDTQYIEKMEILHSDINVVNEFYGQFKKCNTFKSKYLNPVGVVGNNPFSIFKKIFNLLASFLVFFRIFRNSKIDKVLGNNTGDTVFSIWSYVFRKKHINYIHDMIEKESLIAKSILVFDRFIYKYIAVSCAVKNALIEIGIDENKIEVVYNGLKVNQSYKTKGIKQNIVFGFVGNIVDGKNPVAFLKFIKTAQIYFKNTKIKAKMVYGNILDKILFKTIQEYVKKNKLNIELLGRLDKSKMKTFYEDINFLVLTSRRDSLPTVILESFNHGTPVIAHNIDGVPEMVKDGLNGFLYKDTNDFSMIVKKIEKIDYKKMCMVSNKTIRMKFSLSQKVKELDSVLFSKI